MMNLPLIYYPSTLCWVDDDALFLEIATERFKSEFNIKTAFSPKEAVSFFENYEPTINPLTLFRSCFDHEEYDLADHHPVDISFDAIRNIKNNQKKISDIAVIIIDYVMPGMSGIELCHALKDIPAKKILLTGNADYEETIRAFNQGIIHCFIRKDDSDIGTALSSNILRLNTEYFMEQTASILSHIQSAHPLPQSDPVFIEFFNAMAEKLNIKEYYLADKNGSMILINANGSVNHLMIHSDRTLNSFVELHKNTSDAPLFIQLIEEKNKLPFFPLGKEAWEIDINAWPDYFHAHNTLKGREDYYWILIPQNGDNNDQ